MDEELVDAPLPLPGNIHERPFAELGDGGNGQPSPPAATRHSSRDIPAPSASESQAQVGERYADSPTDRTTRLSDLGDLLPPLSPHPSISHIAKGRQ